MCLYVCYVIPESSSRQGIIDTHTLNRLLEQIVLLDSQCEDSFQFILCGDMNAHTSDSPDFVSNDNTQIDFLPVNYNTDLV